MEVKCKDGKLWISLARRIGRQTLIKAVAEGIRMELRQKEMMAFINMFMAVINPGFLHI